ncbi:MULTISPECIES: LLM class flavin-dependent oxidoreductase [unclassified Streptomyces]|uniref:LLM class flavin-dependent oxidoreductase n=1 Tax=unclassified Streptomyces TaxID=2593676 RepID=UPI0006FADBD3|nr:MULTISPECIES: LLM class flavin-dependent oxidoreductase [unclassified Streptomyces]KQX54980.1 FMNH2-dependent monooxygenase [Streptomyces sp. Root1304]KRA94498.1 FMNH2-dependent monooxygenase [Streptomyces sp. Root66D1]
MTTSTRPLHLAAELAPGSGGARPGADTTARTVALARLADAAALDFLTHDDSFGRPGLDALAVLARVAPETRSVGLVPTVTTTHTEPFHVQAAVATLDWVSRGRAGWRIAVSPTAEEARLVGRRPAPPTAELWQEAGEVAEVSRKLWDSWEDDAEIRDVTTGRFVDRRKLHHVDFQGATFSVKGPSIVPRPPQGNPVTVVDATGPAARDTAAHHADVALIRAASAEEAAALRTELREGASAHGRDPGQLRVLLSATVDLDAYEGGPAALAELIAGWHGGGAVDGFHLVPAVPGRDLERFTGDTVRRLADRGLFRTAHEGGTLRDHLGLARPVSQYATAGATA